ncbi:unnamed protein product, partial [Brassica napus]
PPKSSQTINPLPPGKNPKRRSLHHFPCWDRLHLYTTIITTAGNRNLWDSLYQEEGAKDTSHRF